MGLGGLLGCLCPALGEKEWKGSLLAHGRLAGEPGSSIIERVYIGNYIKQPKQADAELLAYLVIASENAEVGVTTASDVFSVCFASGALLRHFGCIDREDYLTRLGAWLAADADLAEQFAKLVRCASSHTPGLVIYPLEEGVQLHDGVYSLALTVKACLIVDAGGLLSSRMEGCGPGRPALAVGHKLSRRDDMSAMRQQEMALATIPSIVTAMLMDGRVVYQNPRSHHYMGNLVRGYCPAPGSSLGALSTSTHPLKQLFRLDPEALQAFEVAMATETEFRRLVKVPKRLRQPATIVKHGSTGGGAIAVCTASRVRRDRPGASRLMQQVSCVAETSLGVMRPNSTDAYASSAAASAVAAAVAANSSRAGPAAPSGGDGGVALRCVRSGVVSREGSMTRVSPVNIRIGLAASSGSRRAAGGGVAGVNMAASVAAQLAAGRRSSLMMMVGGANASSGGARRLVRRCTSFTTARGGLANAASGGGTHVATATATATASTSRPASNAPSRTPSFLGMQMLASLQQRLGGGKSSNAAASGSASKASTQPNCEGDTGGTRAVSWTAALPMLLREVAAKATGGEGSKEPTSQGDLSDLPSGPALGEPGEPWVKCNNHLSFTGIEGMSPKSMAKTDVLSSNGDGAAGDGPLMVVDVSREPSHRCPSTTTTGAPATQGGVTLSSTQHPRLLLTTASSVRQLTAGSLELSSPVHRSRSAQHLVGPTGLRSPLARQRSGSSLSTAEHGSYTSSRSSRVRRRSSQALLAAVADVRVGALAISASSYRSRGSNSSLPDAAGAAAAGGGTNMPVSAKSTGTGYGSQAGTGTGMMSSGGIVLPSVPSWRQRRDSSAAEANLLRHKHQQQHRAGSGNSDNEPLSALQVALEMVEVTPALVDANGCGIVDGTVRQYSGDYVRSVSGGAVLTLRAGADASSPSAVGSAGTVSPTAGGSGGALGPFGGTAPEAMIGSALHGCLLTSIQEECDYSGRRSCGGGRDDGPVSSGNPSPQLLHLMASLPTEATWSAGGTLRTAEASGSCGGGMPSTLLLGMDGELEVGGEPVASELRSAGGSGAGGVINCNLGSIVLGPMNSSGGGMDRLASAHHIPLPSLNLGLASGVIDMDDPMYNSSGGGGHGANSTSSVLGSGHIFRGFGAALAGMMRADPGQFMQLPSPQPLRPPQSPPRQQRPHAPFLEGSPPGVSTGAGTRPHLVKAEVAAASTEHAAAAAAAAGAVAAAMSPQLPPTQVLAGHVPLPVVECRPSGAPDPLLRQPDSNTSSLLVTSPITSTSRCLASTTTTTTTTTTPTATASGHEPPWQPSNLHPLALSPAEPHPAPTRLTASASSFPHIRGGISGTAEEAVSLKHHHPPALAVADTPFLPPGQSTAGASNPGPTIVTLDDPISGSSIGFTAATISEMALLELEQAMRSLENPPRCETPFLPGGGGGGGGNISRPPNGLVATAYSGALSSSSSYRPPMLTPSTPSTCTPKTRSTATGLTRDAHTQLPLLAPPVRTVSFTAQGSRGRTGVGGGGGRVFGRPHAAGVLNVAALHRTWTMGDCDTVGGEMQRQDSLSRSQVTGCGDVSGGTAAGGALREAATCPVSSCTGLSVVEGGRPESGSGPAMGLSGGGGIAAAATAAVLGSSSTAGRPALRRRNTKDRLMSLLTSLSRDDSENEDQGADHEWHDMYACVRVEGESGRAVAVLTQTVVTEQVEVQRKLEALLEHEHKVLESIFPRHVIEHMTLQSKHRSGAPNGAVGGSGAGGGSGGAGGGGPGGGGALGSTWANFRGSAMEALATSHTCVTVLFCDIIGFTEMCKQVSAMVVMRFLNTLYMKFDELIDIYGVYKVETIGDCYMVAGGLVRTDVEGNKSVIGEGSEDALHAVRVMSFAKAIMREAAEVVLPIRGDPVQLRIGLHSGPVMSGIVGDKMPRFCLFGDTVNTASRMESTCPPGAIHVSADTRALLSNEAWVPTGGVQVKGKGLLETYVWAGHAAQEDEDAERRLKVYL